MAIINKYKDTTGAGSEILAKGELASNTVDGTLYVGDGVDNVLLVDTGAEVLPVGTDGQTLRNDSGTWEATSDLTVDSSGNVGIGTDNPSSLLTVEKDTSDLAKFTRSADVEVTVGGSLQVPTVSFKQGAGDACIGSRDPDTMSFHIGSDTASAASERMRIDSSGNVGIGITNPSQKLDVDGSIKLATNGQVLAGQGVSGGYIGYAFNGDPDTGMFRRSADSIGFATAGVRRMYISSGGIVRVTTDGNDDRVAGTASEAGASTIERFVTLSQSEYNALSPDANTLYIII